MATYYLAKSLVKLRAQVNELWPDRDTSSDGWIGDTAHSARVSDHNPDYKNGGVVRALDIDSDGIDVADVIRTAIADNRVRYVIYNGRIWFNGHWKPYTGLNAHTTHVHISIKHTKAAEKGTAWKLGTPDSSPARPSKGSWPGKALPVTSKHTKASHTAWVKLMSAVGYRDKSLTKNIQRWLKGLGYYKRGIDTKFGKHTIIALQTFLRRKGLYKGIIDGKRGPMTIQAEIRYLNLPANRGL